MSTEAFRHPRMNNNTLLLLLAAGALPTRNSRNVSDGKPTAWDRRQKKSQRASLGQTRHPVEAFALPAHTHQIIKQLSYSRLRADKVYADVPHGRCEQ